MHNEKKPQHRNENMKALITNFSGHIGGCMGSPENDTLKFLLKPSNLPKGLDFRKVFGQCQQGSPNRLQELEISINSVSRDGEHEL